MKVETVAFALLLLTSVASAQKVTGSVDGIGVYNFKESHNENLNFSLNYDSPKWFLHSKVDGGYGYNPTDVKKISANWDNKAEEQPFTAANTETKQTFQKRWNTGVTFQSGINFSPTDKLKMDLSAKYRGNNDLDLLRRENYVDGQWRDSASMRQDYFYSSIAPEPFVELQYSIGKIDIKIKERTQIYRHGLTMDRKGVSGQNLPDSVAFDKWDPRNFFSGGIVYRFRPRHKLAVNYDYSISRPDYQKLTDMVKIGDSEGEYFVGNHDLTPQINNNVSLRYTYTFKKTYEFYFDLQYRHIRDKAEKVVEGTKDDGIKYFTYINADKQETGSFRFDLKGAWTRLKAEVYLQANYDFFYKKDAEKAHKTNFSWEAYADLSYAFDKGWKVSARGGYASRQESAYNAKDRYISTNVKVSKMFLNCQDIYIEGRDLTDRELYEYTWNEKMDYCKISLTSSYRRAFVLGMKYIF